MVSLIQIARISDEIAFHANAAKLLAPYAPGASDVHLKNAKTLYVQLGEALLIGTPEKKAD